MSMIVSSNRSRAEWRDYVERNERTSLAALMTETPHTPAVEAAQVIDAFVIRPLDQVIGVDECGAPILPAGAIVACENPY